MPRGTPFTDEDLQRVVDAVTAAGSQRNAMETLGLSKTAIGHHMKRAAEKGLLGFEPVLPGYEIKTTSVTYDKTGAVVRKSIRQGKEAGPAFEMPEAMLIDRMTVQTGPDNRIERAWHKLKTEGSQLVDTMEAIRTAFANYIPVAKIIRAPTVSNDHQLQVYPIVDPHFGMLADGKETGQANDLDKATIRVFGGIDDLVDRAPPARHALLLNTGDYFHADNQRNVTEASGHQLDVDSRHPKILIAGVWTMIRMIERALQKHEFVEYKGLKGNHDGHSAVALTVALAMHFHGNKRVRIDIEGRDFDWYWRLFGKCYIGATHGHNVKPEMMARAMAEVNPDYWGASTHRWFLFGHIHHETVKRVGSVYCESFAQPVPGDAFAHTHFPGGAKAMSSITLLSEGGEYGRHSVSWPTPLPYRAAA